MTVTDERGDAPDARVTTTAPPGAAVRAGTSTPPSGAGWLRRNLDLLTTPIIVVVGLGLVAISVLTTQLDTIEARALEPGTILSALGQHLVLTAYSTIFVVLIAVPLGIALSRNSARRIRGPVLAVGGFAQALPPYGVLVLMVFWTGFNTPTVIAGLVLSALLPVLRNTVVGLQAVDRALIEAARGMGLSARQTLLRVELPLAVPVVVAGIRVALVLNVGTAVLAVYVGGGGLGTLIVQAQALNRPIVLVTAGAIVAALALIVDWLAGVAQRLVAARTS